MACRAGVTYSCHILLSNRVRNRKPVALLILFTVGIGMYGSPWCKVPALALK